MRQPQTDTVKITKNFSKYENLVIIKIKVHAVFLFDLAQEWINLAQVK